MKLEEDPVRKRAIRNNWYHKKYQDNDFGLWKVCGEDPNCDLGGHHYNPLLGYVKGRFIEAFEWGYKQPGWWQWGSGGVVSKEEMAIPTVDFSSPAPVDFNDKPDLIDVNGPELRRLLADAMTLASERFPVSWAGRKVGDALVDTVLKVFKDIRNRKRLLDVSFPNEKKTLDVDG